MAQVAAQAADIAEVAEVAPLMKVLTHYTQCNTEEVVHQHRIQRMWYALKEVLDEKNTETVIMINNESDRPDIEDLLAETSEDFVDKDIKIVHFDSILEDVNKQLKGFYLAFEFPAKISLLGKLLATAFEKSTAINSTVQFGFICTNREKMNYLKALGMEQAKYGNEISNFMRPEKLQAIEDYEKLREEMKARFKPDYMTVEDIKNIKPNANGHYVYPEKMITGPTESDYEDDDYFDERESCEGDYNYSDMEACWDDDYEEEY
ncbi:hypothetical protein GCK72_025676 [Caenorhabditis remanei]|uniref:Uncharacterized protein n=1 Tax=Caenorhabditis remanei TaxID=31234 RepID=A0A6A5G3V9_CAERE|nr:hypothetical protein GCK72_025676 [Caenorhabditis remanei]KAF1749209.1 hypothetical protein GCK72_025676 [Caenorhabditis remanei]